MTSVWVKRKSAKKGQSPGALIHVGDVHSQSPRITCSIYSPEEMQETEIHDDLEGFLASHPLDDNSVLWLSVEGLHEVDIIRRVGSVFNIENLVLEDIADTGHRPKVEEFADYVFLIVRALDLEPTTGRVSPEQVSFILGKNFLITFRESQTPLFQPVQQRLALERSRIRVSGADYLAYSLIDVIVDNYFEVLEKIADKVEVIEDVVVKGPSHSTLQSIYQLKTDLLFLRKSVWPMREISNRMINGDIPFVRDTTKPYLRDVLDHTIHAVDTVETYRDIVSGMLDIYLSAVSNRLNETMKVLTIIATIFIPLTFLCGWYGMNFKYMPELDWRYGYPMVIFIAVTSAVAMLIAFRRKKWL